MSMALVAGVISASSPPARADSPKPPPAASAESRAELGPAQDVLVNGWGDQSGYHLDVATGAGGYHWREVALLRPGSIEDASWTGYQCVSGDGRYAAVAVLPAGAVNLAEARDHGALAYSVELATGTVKPVAGGVALKYHSPGCGVAQTAEFTVNPGTDQRTTQVLTVDLPTGTVKESTTVAGQVTSVVPTPDGPVGAQGAALVRIPAPSSDAGPVEPVALAQVDGLAYDLRPTADGAVAFAVQKDGKPTSTLMSAKGGKVSALGEGPSATLRLMQGRAGQPVALGATKLNAKSGIRNVTTGKLPLGTAEVSLDGAAVLGAGPETTPSAPLVVTTAKDVLLKRDAAGASAAVSTVIPAAAPTAAQAAPAPSAPAQSEGKSPKTAEGAPSTQS
ncbi:type IV secretion protein Rhs, partial [Kitasatospora indigofera]